ncbi:MAG: phospho-sugar mutase [Limnochordia bacterium]|nr:phospho-sugar mutase [Limnochordia bacterium]
MNHLEKYTTWLNSPNVDELTKEELREIKDDEASIEERFWCNLEFGTGGLRGIIGAGTNRMNKYMVRWATQGVANMLCRAQEEPRMVIAYDTRYCSFEFAWEASRVLVANGVEVWLFPEPVPTPLLSFAVRHLLAQAGIMITASHNPAEYNGYKVYGPDGCQLVSSSALAVIDELGKLDIFSDVRVADAEVAKSRVKMNLDPVTADYLQRVRGLCFNAETIQKGSESFSVVYTPLHGAGRKLVPEAMGQLGVEKLYLVDEQMVPDPAFPTVKSPNPEDTNVFALGLSLARKHDASLVLATDPDCDRVGVYAKHQGDYVFITGNQIGVLLSDYILSQHQRRGTLPSNGVVIKTVVTTELVRAVAADYGVEVVDTLTGFKYIGELMGKYESTGERTFLFGFEESHGYLAGDFVRDKDAVIASTLIVEMAGYYQSMGMTLVDRLGQIMAKYGYYSETLRSMTMPGMAGQQSIKGIMEYLRGECEQEILGMPVIRHADFLTSTMRTADGQTHRIDLPKSDVLQFSLVNDTLLTVRPSGTEPKIKLYFASKGDSLAESQEKLKVIEDETVKLISKMAIC